MRLTISAGYMDSPPPAPLSAGAKREGEDKALNINLVPPLYEVERACPALAGGE
jgi:hypothetical protein